MNTYPCEVLFHYHRSVKLPTWRPATMLKKYGNNYICKVENLPGTGSYHVTEVRFPLWEMTKERAASRTIALWWFCHDTYEGQSDWRYRVLSNCRYQPSPCSTWENEVFPDPVCIEYYDRLVDKFERIH